MGDSNIPQLVPSDTGKLYLELETVETAEQAADCWVLLDRVEKSSGWWKVELLKHVEKGRGGRGVTGGMAEFVRILKEKHNIDLSDRYGQDLRRVGNFVEEIKEIEDTDEKPRVMTRSIVDRVTNLPVTTVAILARAVDVDAALEVAETKTRNELQDHIRGEKRQLALDKYMEDASEPPPKYLRSANFWYFNDRDPRYGTAKYKHGVVPGQAIENLLWVYTNIGDLVIDPMCGGGTFLDVAKAWKRPCKAYDIEPIRDDIIHNDIWKGLPEECCGAKLIYLDPPYYNMVQGVFENGAEYFKFQNHIVNVAAENVTIDGFVAYIIMEYSDRDENKSRYGEGKSLIGEAYRALQDHPALEFEACISVPIPQAGFRYIPFDIVKDEHNLVGLNRVIWVAKKIAV